MSNQIVITSGAKLRDLDDVIIGTDGILSSVAFNVANGVPRLDENGKILVSQLPNSVMEFKGVWNAATNTPTLVNGTGNAGDVWLCNVAGTVNFGAGPIAFAVGDYAVYTGTEWARSSGATGTVTSVGVSRDGNALNITGSPVTSSGTINLGFSGNSGQYINGAGNLTTFPTLITSIGLTMPAAFGVSNSPLTSNGTIGVTALGYPSQYIRGDGTLADFPTSGGGGSSVSYYLNGGTSQGTIGGTTYYEMSKTADTGTGVDFSKSGDGLICAFLTDAGDPALLQIPSGNWNYEIYASMSSNGGTPEMYAELYVYNGTTFTLISTSSNEILYDGTNLNLYTFAMAVPQTVLTITDRLAIKLYATNSGGKTTTVHTQDSHLCEIITTFTTGLTALNGLTAQVQYFATGTSGTDFNIVSSVDTHTFNIPSASATNRGLITTGTQTIAGAKTFSSGTKFDLGLFLKESTSSGRLSGYVGISATSTGSEQQIQFLYPSTGSTVLVFPTVSNFYYTFPNATGTVALTSDLSSYVPYTGATNDLDLGNFSIIGNTSSFRNSYINGTSSVQGQLMLKQALLSASNIAGYSSIYSSGTNITIITDVAGTTYKQGIISLSSLTNNTTRTYSLPDASGTLALTSNLSSYLPLSGGTLTGALNITFASGSALLSLNSPTGGTNTIQYTVNGSTRGYTYVDLNYYQFNSYTTYGYVFKNSAAANILTLEDDKTATFSGNINFDNVVRFKQNLISYATSSGYTTMFSTSGGGYYSLGFYNGGGALNQFTFPTASSNSYLLPSASGTVALTSNLSSYVPYSGATTNVDLGTNTLSAGSYISINGTTNGGYLGFKQFSSATSGLSGYTSIFALSTNTIAIQFSQSAGVVKGAYFSSSLIPNNTVYNYNLPSADGTLALTSDLTSAINGTTNTHAKFTSTNAIGNSMVSDDGTTLTSLGATRSNFYIKAANNTYYGQLAFTNGTNSSYGGISYNNSGQYMQFETSNSEWMRLTSGGNLLIGTTTNSGYKLDVNGTGRFSSDLTGGGDLIFNKSTRTTIYPSTSGQNLHIKSNGTGLLQFNDDNTGNISMVLGGGKVGIGTSSPPDKLTIYQSGVYPSSVGDNVIAAIANDGGGVGTLNQLGFGYSNQAAGNFYPVILSSVITSSSGQSNADFIIATRSATTGTTRPTERMRITSGGVVCVGTTSGFTSGLVCSDGGTSYVPFAAKVGTTANSTQIFFNNPNGVVGSITTSGSVTTYNVTSDYRLKQDLKDYNGLGLVSSIKTYDYEWKSDNTRMYGVMAHELAEILPYAVQGEKDGEQMQSVDYSKLTPILVKAIQEQNQTIQELNEKLVRNNIN